MSMATASLICWWLISVQPPPAGGDGTVGVLLGNGDGTFQPAVTYDSGGQNAVSIAVADVNSDSKTPTVPVDWLAVLAYSLRDACRGACVEIAIAGVVGLHGFCPCGCEHERAAARRRGRGTCIS